MISVIMLILSLVFLISIALAALTAYKKGWKWSLVELCRVIVSAVLAFVTVRILASVLPVDTIFENASGDSAAVGMVAKTAVFTVALPFVFFTLFVIIDLIMRIPAHFVNRALREKTAASSAKPDEYIYTPAQTVTNSETNEYSIGSVLTEVKQVSVDSSEPDSKREAQIIFWGKMGGAGIRAVTATLVILLFLLPVTGIFYSFANGIINVADTAEEIDVALPLGEESQTVLGYTLTDSEGNLSFEEMDRLIDDTIGPIHSNVFFKLSYSAPMRALYNAVGAAPGSNISKGNEIEQVFGIMEDAIYLTVDMKDYGEDQKNAVIGMSEYISESELHSGIVAELVSSATEGILESEALKNGGAGALLVPLIEELANTTADTVGANFETLGAIISAMIDHDIFAELDGDIVSAFADKDFLYDVLSAVNENENFRNALPSIVELSFETVVVKFDGNADVADIDFDIEQLTDEELRSEAEILSLILSDSMTVIDSFSNGEFDLSSMGEEMRALGRTLDSSMESIFIGDNVKHLFIAILDSGIFGEDKTGMTDIVKDHIDDADLNMENLLVALQQFTVILDNFKNEGSTDVALLADTMRNLSASFDGSTAVILKEIINNSSIFSSSDDSASDGSEGDGEGSEQTAADSMQTIMNVFVDKLAANEISDEEYEEEAKALDYVMQIVSVAEDSGANGIKNVYGNSDGMNDMISTMISSKITSASINAIAYDDEGNLNNNALNIAEGVDDEDVENLVNGCEKYYTEETAKADCDVELLETNLKSIASIFGEDITDDINSWKSAK